MTKTTRRHLLAWRTPFAAVMTTLALASCGGDGNDTAPARTAEVRFGDMQALQGGCGLERQSINVGHVIHEFRT